MVEPEAANQPSNALQAEADVGTFKAAYATSPMAFVMKVQLHHAATLMTTTDRPIKRIASNAGLSRSYFSRAFHVA